MTGEPQQVPAIVDWSRLAELPLAVGNAFATAPAPNVGPDGAPDGVLLSIGTITPPVIHDENHAKALFPNGVINLTVSPVAHIFLTRERIAELSDVLRLAAEQLEMARLHAGRSS